MKPAEIERRIAELRGWKYGYFKGCTSVENHWHKPNPQGNYDYCFADVPTLDWTLAGELLEEAKIDVGPSADGQAWTACAGPHQGRLDIMSRLIESRSNTPLEAIALAWIAWKESQVSEAQR